MKEALSKNSLAVKKKNGAKGPKTLGPVCDLEEHVFPDWWCRIFNSLYLKTDADVVDDREITRQEVDLYVQAVPLQVEERVLDLCCGQGRHSLELARRGLKHLFGLDRSHYLIQKAKASAKKEKLSIQFREGDARRLPYPVDFFDVVLILGNSFGYFESIQDDLRVLREVARVLKPWGRILVDVADGEYLKKHFQPRSWEWIDRKYFVCRERSLSKDQERLISREIINHVEKGVVVDQFYGERLYARESLAELLQSGGLSEVNYHTEFSPVSQRNQDLGMMAQRLIVSARVKKNWAPVRKKGANGIRNVAVLLGDPVKPDLLKPGSIFDDDDIYTIDQLKSALRELTGYRFFYLDDHESLIRELFRLKNRVDFVFNLCDEGFKNDPRKELHVPAILEMLDIPYTGSNPQCLAFCYDKSLVRGVAKEMGVPVPAACFVQPEQTTFELSINFPVIVKPNYGDSSFGITQRSVATQMEELINAVTQIREQFGYDKPILVEEFLPGKDLSLGILGNPPDSYTVLPLIEEDYSALPPELPWICGYEAKWIPESPYWKIQSVPARLPEEVEKIMVENSLKLFERLECRDYVRFDWRLDAGGSPKLLEVNPNPGWCWDGHLVKMARFAHMKYPEVLETILKSAEIRLGLAGKETETPHEVKNEELLTV
ncbi:MAG TPA: methyltransferase domain-containing protein [Atribacteraceae bacterium]|nr:methyltransferase domain-containing protein [Atribacteraceae bacterium]